MKSRFLGLLTLAIAAASPAANAGFVTWTDWTSITTTSAVGTMGGTTVNVTSVGLMNGPSQTACGTNWWTQPNLGSPAYTGGSVSNAPTACEQVALDSPVTVTVNFSTPVGGLYMALLSVGRSNLEVTYDFNQAFTVDSEGEGFWGNGTYTLAAGDVIKGNELHGVLAFSGPVSSLTFTTTPSEYWHAFTFGVPEPGMLALFGLGLVGLGFAGRRKAA
jgi:hypothetical protein